MRVSWQTKKNLNTNFDKGISVMCVYLNNIVIWTFFVVSEVDNRISSSLVLEDCKGINITIINNGDILHYNIWC